ncbi:phosphoethanolamine transferase [Pseudorhodobacter ferrugineus]|uniref:phosphoethanolamine transferase n=1 Tax=Pseudorhodobacter ferrugineus TaxID=77008 RepID=UPI00040BCBF6|nr:phosphoethanolamine--lipid A transferase [Pseudorhodobacter ferrugineus]
MTAPLTHSAPFWQRRPTVNALVLNVATALFILAAHNVTFWGRVGVAFDGHVLTVAIFAGAIFALTLLLIALFAVRWLQKPMLAFFLILGAVTSYYQDTLGATIDREMIQNAITTTVTESKHLITASFVFHVLWAGILPAAVVFWVKVARAPLVRAAVIWAGTVAVSVVLCVGLLLTQFATFSVVLRAQKQMMAAYQPGAPLTGTLRYARMLQKSKALPLQAYGTDAKPSARLAAVEKPVLLVVVAGETARAQNWSLGGYGPVTNPELAKRDITYFPNVSSCGTATAVSLPCMFASYGRADYSYDKGVSTENMLDILARAGYHVEWWDNNTGDKGIAKRQTLEMVLKSTDPRYCADGECTDGIFLDKLTDYADSITQNTVLVLHMIGSHGPSYYLRYPAEFEHFTPTCKTAELKTCSTEEITNAYDNTIVYTDHILASMIDILAAQTKATSALFYASDHGESLGEGGLYLHGAPYFMAPEYQTRVPMLTWIPADYEAALGLQPGCLAAGKAAEISHDNMFSTVLSLAGVETSVIDPALDLIGPCRNAS